MNRAERRRLGAPKERTYTLTDTQIARIKADATNKGLDTAFILMLGIPVMVIHDKYPQLMRREVDGLSREERFTDLSLDLYDSFIRGFISLDDIKDCLAEECGINIKDIMQKKIL